MAGEKTAPLPLGGINGLATIFSTIRQIPKFSNCVPVNTYNISPGENILISTTDFAKDVSDLFMFKFV